MAGLGAKSRNSYVYTTVVLVPDFGPLRSTRRKLFGSRNFFEAFRALQTWAARFDMPSSFSTVPQRTENLALWLRRAGSTYFMRTCSLIRSEISLISKILTEFCLSVKNVCQVRSVASGHSIRKAKMRGCC